MKNKSLQRAFLLASGICAVLVILLSHSFYQNSNIALKTEKAKGQKEISIHAPSDVASQGHSIELNEQQPSQVQEIILSDEKNDIIVFVQKTTVNFFKTLFRVIISPNAP